MNNGAESPRPSRKRFGSASEETILKQVNGDGLSIANGHELDTLKAELLQEIRLEINKAKQEIIDGECVGKYSTQNSARTLAQLSLQPCLCYSIQLLKPSSTGGKAEEVSHSIY